MQATFYFECRGARFYAGQFGQTSRHATPFSAADGRGD